MTREELDTIRARVLMPGVGFRGTPLRAEILSLLRAAEDALRYKKALETVVSIGNGKADGLTVIQMWNEARAALAPKEENRG